MDDINLPPLFFELASWTSTHAQEMIRDYAAAAVLADRAQRDASRHAPAVPEGMVLVPIEPSEKMKNAGWSQTDACMSPALVWKVMIAAASEKTK